MRTRFGQTLFGPGLERIRALCRTQPEAAMLDEQLVQTTTVRCIVGDRCVYLFINSEQRTALWDRVSDVTIRSVLRHEC